VYKRQIVCVQIVPIHEGTVGTADSCATPHFRVEAENVSGREFCTAESSHKPFLTHPLDAVRGEKRGQREMRIWSGCDLWSKDPKEGDTLDELCKVGHVHAN
jgi:hypothetical protein